MRFVLGNQNTVLLEASCTGNLRKVQQALDKASALDVNRKGQVSSPASSLAVQVIRVLPLPLLDFACAVRTQRRSYGSAPTVL